MASWSTGWSAIPAPQVRSARGSKRARKSRYQKIRPRGYVSGRGNPGRFSYEREPRWFPLIARAAPPQALLSFRYTVGIFLKSLEATRGDLRDIVAPGMNPAAKATLVIKRSP